MRQLHDTYRALEGGGSEGGGAEPGLRVKEVERRGGIVGEGILKYESKRERVSYPTFFYLSGRFTNCICRKEFECQNNTKNDVITKGDAIALGLPQEVETTIWRLKKKSSTYRWSLIL